MQLIALREGGVTLYSRRLRWARAMGAAMGFAFAGGAIGGAIGGLTGCAAGNVAAARHVGSGLALDLPTADGAGRVRSAELAGRVLLVDVWATWCKPCMDSMPFYAELHRALEPQGFTMIGVSVDTEAGAAAKFAADEKLPFPIAADPDGDFAARLDVQTMPTAFLVGRDGKVRWVHAGFHAEDRAEIEAKVRAALAEPASGVTAPAAAAPGATAPEHAPPAASPAAPPAPPATP